MLSSIVPAILLIPIKSPLTRSCADEVVILIGLLKVIPLIALPPALALALAVASSMLNLDCCIPATSLTSGSLMEPVANPTCIELPALINLMSLPVPVGSPNVLEPLTASVVVLSAVLTIPTIGLPKPSTVFVPVNINKSVLAGFPVIVVPSNPPILFCVSTYCFVTASLPSTGSRNDLILLPFMSIDPLSTVLSFNITNAVTSVLTLSVKSPLNTLSAYNLLIASVLLVPWKMFVILLAFKLSSPFILFQARLVPL